MTRRTYWSATTRDELRDCVLDWFYRPECRVSATDTIYGLIWERYKYRDHLARVFTEWKDAVLRIEPPVYEHHDIRLHREWTALSNAITDYPLSRKPL
jgi:hypothetical protein